MKKKRLQKSIITFVLAAAMVTGALPLPNITMVARAAEVTESEIASWEALKGNSNAATVTTADGVTTITLNSCIKLTAKLAIASGEASEQPYVLDLNGYGIRYAGTNDDSVIEPVWKCSSLTLKDSNPSSATYYIALTDGRGTAVSNSAPSGTEGTDYLAVTGGYITGGKASSSGGGVWCGSFSFTMEGGTICGNKAGSDGGVAANNFTMSGGAISYNSATSETGGVSISNKGTALMTGGTIAHNSGPSTDVYNYSGTFVMTGGTIGYAGQSGNSVNNTGHFYLKSGSTLYGTVDCNAAQTLHTVTVGSLTNGQITVSDPAWTDNTTQYYASGDTVTLTITPDTGYEFGTITVTKASGGTVEVSGTGNTCTFTMPDDNVTVSATFTQPGVSYIDEDGKTQTCTEYTILTGNETNSLAAGWYVVNSNITRSGGYGLDGDVNLILCDNASLEITGNGNGFNGTLGDTKYGLTVYGQSDDTGKMTIETTSDPILVKSLTVNGGELILKSERQVFAINIVDGDLTVNGGSVTVDTKIDNSNAVHGTDSNKVVMNGGTLTATSGNGWCIDGF
ncbi:MAG: hypothetical protein J6Z46_08160, partial [Lachnospiraceae bacterium]|nr:hypothetical protein [Lachnospiraceae bacterium]